MQARCAGWRRGEGTREGEGGALAGAGERGVRVVGFEFCRTEARIGGGKLKDASKKQDERAVISKRETK